MKKKTFFTLAAVCMTLAANATILRVSNVSGSSAPYSDLQKAIDAAAPGDTIMFDKYDGGANSSFVVDKKLVLIGPGYWLVENGVVQESDSYASVTDLYLDAEGIVVQGMDMFRLHVRAPKTVINRCKISRLNDQETMFTAEGQIDLNTDNTIVSQCFIYDKIEFPYSSYTQITNNIITNVNGNYRLELGDNSYVAYNTFRINKVSFMYVQNATVEHNLWAGYVDPKTNSFSDNYLMTVGATDSFKDKDYYALEYPEGVKSNYGAFGGDSPYVLSGVPAAPVIQDLVMPTTVEKGSKMNVTIKVGIQK